MYPISFNTITRLNNPTPRFLGFKSRNTSKLLFSGEQPNYDPYLTGILAPAQVDTIKLRQHASSIAPIGRILTKNTKTPGSRYILQQLTALYYRAFNGKKLVNETIKDKIFNRRKVLAYFSGDKPIGDHLWPKDFLPYQKLGVLKPDTLTKPLAKLSNQELATLKFLIETESYYEAFIDQRLAKGNRLHNERLMLGVKAPESSQIIGMATIAPATITDEEAQATPPPINHIACMEDVAVNPKYRGRGYGTRLHQAAVAAAKQHGYEQLILRKAVTKNGRFALQDLLREEGFREVTQGTIHTVPDDIVSIYIHDDPTESRLFWLSLTNPS